MKLKKEFKIIFCFLLFSGLLTNEYAAVFLNPFFQSQNERLYMVRKGNLRESNDINSSIITVLDSGTVVMEIEKDNVNSRWFHVELENGTRGWIYQSLLKIYEDDYLEKAKSEVALKTDEKLEMKSEELKEGDNKEESEENVSLILDRKSLSESVPQVIENPVNKYLFILIAVLLVASVSLLLLFYKSRKRLKSIVINSKNVLELEDYKKENEIKEEDVQVLNREIDSSLNLYKIYMHQFIQKIRQSYS